MKNKSLLAVIGLCIASGVGAQTIYRCGSSYGAQPCPGATTIEPVTAPSEAQAEAARDEVRREVKLADEMHAERVDAQASNAAAQEPRKKAERARPVRVKLLMAKQPKKAPKTAPKKTPA